MTGVRRILSVLVALVMASFAVPAMAMAAPSFEGVHTYVYESQLHAAEPTHTTTERGPPATYTDVTTYDADGFQPGGALACPNAPTKRAIYDYDDPARFVHAGRCSRGAEELVSSASEGSVVLQRSDVAANGGSRIAVNQAAGNAARDALAAAHPGSLIEQSFSTTAGVRRLDVLTQGGLGIESKVGRTSLTAATRSQIAKDSLLLRNGDVTGMEWVFSRSGVTGQIGPTGPLADALGKAGIPWSSVP